MRTFDRKVLRKIFGHPVESGCWRRRRNSEIYKPDDDEHDVVTFIKLGRLRWAGHVMRMEESDAAKKFLCAKTEGNGNRKRGRHKLRWCDELRQLGAEIGELPCSRERSGTIPLRKSGATQGCRPNGRRKTGTLTITRTTTTGVFQLRI